MPCGIGQTLVAAAERYSRIAFFVAGVPNICQAGAVMERRIANISDAVRNRDARQVSATIKSILANASDAVRDADAGQTGATEECPFTNASDTVRDGDAG